MPDVTQISRYGPGKAFWSPKLRYYAEQALQSGVILHGHGFYTALNWILGRTARRRLVPLVYHVHGIFEPWIIRRSKLKKQIAHWLFEDANFRHARIWRALHAKEADQIRFRGIKAPIVIAPNGVRLEDLDSVPSPLKPSRRQVLFLSRLHPKKGIDLLIPAWKALAATRKDWELLIVGPDEGGYKSSVEKMIRECGVAQSVRLKDSVLGAAKVSLLKSAEIFILPSYSEGFSVAILEALACGVPVIATDACNFPELATSGAGWECFSTMESVLEALQKALSESDEERQQRGLAGRRLVEQHYTWPVIAKTILDACQEYCM